MIRVALLTCVFVGSALAEDRPVTIPTRDVGVIYRVGGGSGDLTQRMRWNVASGRLRVDPPTRGMHMIVDYRSKRISAINDETHRVTELDAARAGVPLDALAGSTFTRVGSATVAGLSCDDYATRDAAGAETQICLTVDGVLLRARARGAVVLEAADVRYGAQESAAFTVPEGYSVERR